MNVPGNRPGWLFQRFIVRSLLQNKLRSVLTVLGIALGVAIFLAINLANQTALQSFEQSVEQVSGRANLEILPAIEPTMDESLLEDLRWLWRTDSRFTPLIEQTLLIPAPQGDPARGEVVNVLGVDMMADTDFRAYDWTPAGSIEGAPEETLGILRPDHAFIGHRLADRYELSAGDTLPVLAGDRQATLIISGVLSTEGLGAAYGGNLIMMDIGPAQRLFEQAGRISRIDLIVPSDRLTALQQLLSERLGETRIVQRPERRGAQVERMLASYQYNLLMLSFIALLVGLFLIYNTMSISILRRRPEIGTLRAIGAERKTILALFSTEALMLGLIGTTLGIALGMVLAGGAVEAVSATVETLYTGQPVTGVYYDPLRIVLAFVFGVAITLLGALAPVLEATQVPPAEATRRGSYEDKAQHYAAPLAGVGTVLLLGAGVASLQPPVGGLPLFGFLSALLIILGVACWTPALIRLFLRGMLPGLARVFQAEGRLSGLSLSGALGRTSVAVVSLMIGIAMMVSLAMMIGSFRQTVVTWVNQTLQADLWIEPTARTARQPVAMREEVIEAIGNTPGVAVIDTFMDRRIIYNDQPTFLGVGDFEVMGARGRLNFTHGEPTEAVLARVLDEAEPGVIVTESFSLRHGVERGQTLTLPTPQGRQEFRIEGVYYDYTSDLGYIVMPRIWYEHFFGEAPVYGVAVFLAPGVSVEAARQAIFQAVGPEARLQIQTNRELRAEVLEIFDRTFAITYALHAIAIAVALLAVMNALFALILESRREFGILKYLGATRQQVEKIVLIEAGLLGLFGNVLGLVVGFLLSFLLIYVINMQSFGWTIQYVVPGGFLIQSFILVMLTAVLAGIVPARMAAQTPAPEVIRAE